MSRRKALSAVLWPWCRPAMRSRSMSLRDASTCASAPTSSRAAARPGSRRRRVIRAVTERCSQPISGRRTKAATSIFCKARRLLPSPRFTERQSSLRGGQHHGAAFAEADPGMTRLGANCAEADLVAVFDKRALFSARQRQRLRTAGGELQQTGPARWLRPGYRAGADQVADLEIAAIAGVMRNHLGEGPVHLRGRTLRQAMRRHAVAAHGLAGHIGFEGYVEAALSAVLRVIEMRQRRRIALRPGKRGSAKRRQGFGRHHPG